METYLKPLKGVYEMEAVKKKKGITIRVNRNLEESKDQHESETELDNAEFDYVIDNNGTIEELIEKVKEILNCMLHFYSNFLIPISV